MLWRLILLGALCSLIRSQKIGISGRVGLQSDPEGQSEYLLSWPATSLRAQFEGAEAVSVSLQARASTSATGSLGRFRVTLDSAVSEVSAGPGQEVFNWSRSGLSLEPHELIVTKLTEAFYGTALLRDVSLSGGRFLLPAKFLQAGSRRKIQFVGDSYTAGLGNIGNASCPDIQLDRQGQQMLYPAPETQDATQTWGALVAQHFKADYEILAWSGAFQNPGELPDPSVIGTGRLPTIPQLFLQQVAGDNTSRWNVSSDDWLPQVVVLAGGTNDFHNPPPPIEDWTAQYVAFIQQVQEVYASPFILVLGYPQELQNVGVLGPQQSAQYQQYTEYLAKEIQHRSMNNVQFLQIDAQSMVLTDWCAVHPNAGAHRVIAEQVTKHLEAVFPA